MRLSGGGPVVPTSPRNQLVTATNSIESPSMHASRLPIPTDTHISESSFPPESASLCAPSIPMPSNRHSRSVRTSTRSNCRRGSVPVARSPYKEPCAQHNLGPMNLSCQHCSALHWADERLSKSSLSSPHFGTCCDDGKVQLQAFEDPPLLLRTLLTSQTVQAQEFRNNIRQYNAALAMCSLGVKVDTSVTDGRGPYCFRISGELSHRIGSLLPSGGRDPTYSQLYFYDP